MSKFKGTPGPWRVARQNGSPTTGEWMIAGAKPGYLAEVRDCGGGFAAANAHLIAAAPALLEAAQIALSIAESWIHDQLDGTSQLEVALRELSPVRDAIARALGEGQ